MFTSSTGNQAVVVVVVVQEGHAGSSCYQPAGWPVARLLVNTHPIRGSLCFVDYTLQHVLFVTEEKRD